MNLRRKALRVMASLVAMAAALAIVGVACINNDINHTKVPGTDCYVREQACAGGGCCLLYQEECGGIWPNCPKGYCCPVDDNGRAFGARPAGAVSGNRPVTSHAGE